MSEQDKKQANLLPLVIISAIILAVVVIWAVVKQQHAEDIQAGHQHQHNHEHSFELLTEGADGVNQPKMNLNNLIKARKDWKLVHTNWYGKTAPDFTLTDIAGKQHKLSDYRGKNVMIVFWATWCPACLMEIPHLIALRNIISEDKLAMLAISYITPYNTTEMVKNVVERNKRINYAVFCSDIRIMPVPFNAIDFIPCTFFINPDGKIKLALENALSLGEMKAILQAE